MEIGEDLEEFLIGLIDPPDEIGELVLLEVLAECPQALIHELVDFDRVVVLVAAVDGEADGADESSVLAGTIDTHESRVLPVGVAVVGLDEFLKALREVLNLGLN